MTYILNPNHTELFRAAFIQAKAASNTPSRGAKELKDAAHIIRDLIINHRISKKQNTKLEACKEKYAFLQSLPSLSQEALVEELAQNIERNENIVPVPVQVPVPVPAQVPTPHHSVPYMIKRRLDIPQFQTAHNHALIITSQNSSLYEATGDESFEETAEAFEQVARILKKLITTGSIEKSEYCTLETINNENDSCLRLPSLVRADYTEHKHTRRVLSVLPSYDAYGQGLNPSPLRNSQGNQENIQPLPSQAKKCTYN